MKHIAFGFLTQSVWLFTSSFRSDDSMTFKISKMLILLQQTILSSFIEIGRTVLPTPKLRRSCPHNKLRDYCESEPSFIQDTHIHLTGLHREETKTRISMDYARAFDTLGPVCAGESSFSQLSRQGLHQFFMKTEVLVVGWEDVDFLLILKLDLCDPDHITFSNHWNVIREHKTSSNFRLDIEETRKVISLIFLLLYVDAGEYLIYWDNRLFCSNLLEFTNIFDPNFFFAYCSHYIS